MYIFCLWIVEERERIELNVLNSKFIFWFTLNVGLRSPKSSDPISPPNEIDVGIPPNSNNEIKSKSNLLISFFTPLTINFFPSFNELKLKLSLVTFLKTPFISGSGGAPVGKSGVSIVIWLLVMEANP